MIFRLRGPSREKIEQRIPFDLYREDEDGNQVFIPATERYSYVFRGHEELVEAKYDEDGNMTKAPKLSPYVIANIRVYDNSEMEEDDEVKFRFPEHPRHGWT